MLAPDFVNQFFQLAGCRRLKNLAACPGALLHAEAQIGSYQRFYSIEGKIVEFGTRLPPDLDGILETAGRDQRHASAFAL